RTKAGIQRKLLKPEVCVNYNDHHQPSLQASNGTNRSYPNSCAVKARRDYAKRCGDDAKARGDGAKRRGDEAPSRGDEAKGCRDEVFFPSKGKEPRWLWVVFVLDRTPQPLHIVQVPVVFRLALRGRRDLSDPRRADQHAGGKLPRLAP